MARRPILGTGTLNPFGGSGVNFDAFNVAASMGEQAYLLFRKKEIEWEAGRISDDEYLAALQAYGAALPEGSEKLNAQNRYDETRSRLTRNRLIGDIEDGTKEWEDLLSYDLAELAKVTNTNSQTYDERIQNVRQVQGRMFSDQEDVQRERYSDGLLTAAQLLSWYEDKLGGDLTDNNPELDEQIGKRIDEVKDIVVSERDAKMVGDFNAGKVGYQQFVAYGNTARARYAKGTQQYDDWTERLTEAKEQAIEQSITYRYGLSQRYEQLARFIKDHGEAPKGHTTTSTSGGRQGTKRVVWNGSAWVTVRVGATSGGTRTTYHGPTAAQLKAWKEVQQEVAEAKKEMARIKSQLGRQPGGFVSTTDMVRYYTKVQTTVAKGSPEWYTIQERLDGLNQQAAKEKVFAKQGLKISYPKVSTERTEFGTGGAGGNLPPSAGGTVGAATVQAAAKGAPTATAKPKATSSTAARAGEREIGIDEFMRAIARVESGGRYDAVNRSSGARGKYQIMPANWAGWASKYLGNANAAWTPENQEKVARGKMQDLYRWLKDWRAVAHWWLTGGSNADMHRTPGAWSSSSRSYVNKVFAGLGLSPAQVSGTAYRAAGTGGGGVTPSAPAAGYAGGGGGVAGGSSRGSSPTGAPPSGGGAAGYQGQEIPRRSALRIPKGLDAAQFERFYDRFLAAYENGDENFVDYSTGRPINYYIPADLEARSELVSYLDEVRIAAFAAKAKAYEGSPSEQVAMTQYSDAIKKAGENQMLVLITNQKPPKPYVTYAGFTVQRGDYKPPSPKTSINPIAEGLKLKTHVENALNGAARAAKAALARGDVEAAYNLVQNALNLAATNDQQMTQYYANAAATIRAIRQSGAKVPEQVQTDLEALAEGLDFDLAGGASEGYSKALQSLEETTSEIEKWIQFDANDEPVRRRGATDEDDIFATKPGVELFLKPNGEVEYRQTSFSGWTDRTTAARDQNKYVSVTVKVGSSVKQVKAEWQVGQVGFIAGTNIAVQGRLITGMANGREYVWVENPFAPGKWIRTDPSKPLTIKAPTGLTPFRNPDGSYSLEFTGGNQKYRLQFDEDDGTYHVYQPPGLLGSEWTDLGSASSSSDLKQLYRDAGWGVDASQFAGEDRYFFDSTGPWIGFSQAEREQAIRNTQSPRRMPGIPGHTTYGPGSGGYAATTPRSPMFGGLSPDERDEAKRDEAAAARRVGGGYGQMGEPFRAIPGHTVYGPGSGGYAATSPRPLVPADRDDRIAASRALPPVNRAYMASASKDDRITPTVKKTPAKKPPAKAPSGAAAAARHKQRIAAKKPPAKPLPKKTPTKAPSGAASAARHKQRLAAKKPAPKPKPRVLPAPVLRKLM